MKKYIGTITKIRGYDGTLVVSDMNEEFIIPVNSQVYIGYSEKYTKPYILTYWNMKSKKAICKLKNIDNETEASKLKEYGLFIEENLYLQLVKEFGLFQINEEYIIIDEGKNIIGNIIEIWELPANDVWLVNTERGELPVPVLEENIIEINEDTKEITYKMIDGLMDLLDNNREEDE